MNINEELNRIIFKYNLDRCYPHYRNMYKAEKVLRDLIKGITQKKGKAVFIGDDPKGIKFIQNIARDYKDIAFFCYKRDDIKLNALESVQWKEFENIYLISFYNIEHIERWLRVHKLLFRWIYDIFEEKEIYFQKEFFVFGEKDTIALFDPERVTHTRSCYTGMFQCELYSQKCRYNYRRGPENRVALEKCLFMALLIKNFVEAKEYISLLVKADEKYSCFWEEIEKLLETIRAELKKRQGENIILYWLDALPYGEEDDMPYLREMKNKSVVFQNAYTYIAYTSSTARTVFLGKKDIDDGVYDISDFTEENSPVIRTLKKQKYQIKIISGMLDSMFPYSCRSEQFYMDVFDPCSMKMWEMLSDMLCHRGNTFYLIHIMESHDPYLSRRLSDENYTDHNERCRLARLEIDEQLAFYDSLLNQKDYRIYMSDHGRVLSYKYHVVFNIYQERLHPRTVDGMFSLLDFYKVLDQIVAGEDIKEKKLIKEYVEVGNLDRYDKNDIRKVIGRRRDLEERDFGCTGIIDGEYIYLRNTLGKEQLFSRDAIPLCDPLLFYDFEVYEPQLLAKYRNLSGEYPEEMQKAEKFKYSVYLYRLYDNLKKRSGHVSKCVEIINYVLEKYKENSVAVRGGGYHSLVLYHTLSKENRKKIWGFIDKTANCQCARLGMPVVGAERAGEWKELGVKAILLSSYDLLDIFRKEAMEWPDGIDILDIYASFEKNGMACSANFYNVLGTDEDYNVGFPFEEGES